MKLTTLQYFIEQHLNWEKILVEKPYCITITRDRVFNHNLIMFKYSQIDSDFHIELVRECRGLILDEDTFEPVCIPFFKFGNYGESYCPEIDWKSCWVGEKLDGSLIKIVKMSENNLLISTNGTIDAFKAPIVEQIGCKSKNFGELALEGLAYYGLNKEKLADMLDYNKTYMFELTSPFNKVVVTWHETRLNFLGVRDNVTFQETYFSDHELAKVFNTPKVLPLGSIDECVEAAKVLDCNAEGYVVCDKNFNRVKVKSPTYVNLHHMKNNGSLSYTRAIELVKLNEVDEVLSYFPEFKDALLDVKSKYMKLLDSLEDAWSRFKTEVTSSASRKEAALWIQKNFDIPGVGFSLLDSKVQSVKEWIEKCPAKNLAKHLGYKE